ncbi:flagella biosynthesis regulator Flk [Rahnella sp. SAP-1]|jgi:hypothetical protein|uniref:Flagella biosynthesis regulator Flk n=1 Tax=Rouxiella aceris TaxID=2703884 RepID=A0A848MQ14_9GAMM|nr:flagella biosynthesis regulator Flk [Rouxiella aceris]NMP29100.1 flagella biosynthesis regulator Flk [Rouxiella aceris]
MQPLSGPSSPVGGNRAQPNGPTVPAGPGENQPLTPAQRTTLEKLIVKIMALTTMKSPEIWATLRHDLAVAHDSELTTSQFPRAESLLQGKLTQAQDSHATRQLMQQLTELLPLGNNRQAVSDFIRQNYGHTVLSQLSHAQLETVLVSIQSREMTIPQPQQTAVMDRALLPAEQSSLQQSVAKLSAATGEAPAKIWQELFVMVGVKVGEPIPAKHFQLLTQFAQVKITVSQQNSPTLATMLSVLKQPATPQEQHRLTEFVATNFNATPDTPLTPIQINDLIGVLFNQRVDRSPRSERQDEELTRVARTEPKPWANPFIAMLPESMRASGGTSLAIVLFLVIVVVLWLVI